MQYQPINWGNIIGLGEEIGRFSRKTTDEIAKIFKERDIIYQS